MCSTVFEFLDMDNFQGDLTDIIRGSGGHVSPSPAASPTSWQSQPLPPSDLLVDFPASTSQNNSSFGDPFVNMSDPLLQELSAVAASGYFVGSVTPGDSVSGSSGSSCSNNSFMVPNNKVFEDDIKSQCNVFPRIRISHQSNIIHEASPCNSPVMAAHTAAAAAAVVSSSPRGIINRSPVGATMAGNDHHVINVNTNGPNNNCLVDNNSSSQIQISSPRNLGLKRRKSQAKKVVCIPAPAAANSRSSGEVVPSDLWAWRKYGQKPIKGSPYPRGYYRCSSSKGCSARKQVERSRTDPNMLVITYTSEHNHPWPTQRNALAGSTRSCHPSKSTPANTPTSSSTRISQSHLSTKEEPKSSEDHHLFAGCSGGGVAPASTAAVKEEIEDQVLPDEHQDMEFDNHNHHNHDHDQSSLYRPELLPDFQQPEDFFADLDELEVDPLSVLLSQGFSSKAGDDDFKGKTSSDPFGNFFDWSSSGNHNENHNHNQNDNTTSFDDGDSSKSSL